MLDFEVSALEAVLALDLSQIEQGVILHNNQLNPASTIHLALTNSGINNNIILHASTCLVGISADLVISTYNNLEISTENFIGFNSVKVEHINSRQAIEQPIIRSAISEEDIIALSTIIPAQNRVGYLKLLQLFARNPNYKITDIQNVEQALHVSELYQYSLIVLRDAVNNHHAVLSEDTIEYLVSSLITYSPEQNILELRNSAFLLFSLSLNNQYPKNLEKLALILDKYQDQQLNLYIVKTLENSSSRKLKQIPEFETLLQEIILNPEKSLEVKEYCHKIITKLHDQDLVRTINNSQNLESFGNEKDLDILLTEIESLNKETKIEVLKDKYNQVIRSYNHDSVFSPQGLDIKAWDKTNISNWAKLVKESGKAKEHDFIAEVIAVIKRANIIDCNNDPRIVQVLSLLAFNTSMTQGMLAQISTGEGKSTIIAMLAVIKALQSEVVDVVTSSYILAKRDALDKREFFEMFGLSVDHNCDQQQAKGFKACYGADIVYGDISNFQYDLLRHAYSQLGTRGNREFGIVIVDEVDSMLIDENAKIAMLSHHIPATEYLEPLLSILFDELDRFDRHVVYLPETETWNYVDGAFKYENDQIILQDENSNIYELDDITQFRFEHLKYHLEKVILEEVIHIPLHLKELALNQIEVWIKSCIDAKNLIEKKNYLIIQDKDANDVIVPIDYHNTGIVQAKTSWTNGLHQLLQIKHGLKITPESLVTSFISNLGFFKNYGKKIYGMTGTLGSIDAQELLAYIYEIDLVFIPTYKHKRFEELSSILSNSQEEWLSNITQTTIEHTSNGRAVLIICESIKNVELVNNALLEGGYPSNHIKLYSRNDTNENLSVAESIDSKDIIIATNLAGRGTDIKTTGNVEKNGGLHVCVSFLPANLRVELQAFGRTARQGNEGTAQLIINEQEASQLLHIDSNTITTIEEFKNLRDEQEHNKLQRVKLYDAEKIILEDQLFYLFCKLTHELKAKENSKSKLSQLEENWGITFRSIKQQITNILNSLPAEEKTSPISIKNIILKTKRQVLLKFNEFRARMLLEYSSGYEIMRNPAYLVTESFNNMATGGYERSAELFALAANLDDNFSISAHYNAAYAIIRGKIGNYKQAAFEHLDLAADGIKQVLIPSLEVLQVTGTKSGDSPLTKQIIQKIELLKLQLNYIDKTKATIVGCADRNYIEISENKLLREFFTSDKTPEAEILELNVFGIHTFYDVKEVEPPTDIFGAIFMAVAAVVQIGIGIACTMSGNVALGASLLIEGFQDGLKAMKIANNEDFDWKNYFSAKGISAAVTVITIGATSLMNKLATVKTASELGKEAAKQALLEAGKEVTEKAIKQELMKQALKEVVKRVVINTAIDKIANKAMGHVLNEFKDKVRQHVERNINHCLDSAVTHNQLMHLFEMDDSNGNTNNYRAIMESALNVLKNNQSIISNITSRVINEVASNHTMPSSVKLLGSAAKVVDTGKAIIEIQNVVDKVQDRLSSNIANLDQKRPDIAGMLEQKLQPVFNSTKARETVAILENAGFIVNGKFVKIDGIDEVDFDKYEHLKKYIINPCKKLYEAQHKDYSGLKQKFKSDLSNHVIRVMLAQVRSEIMHPILASPLAKLSNMVTDGIAKTFEEFAGGGQRLKKIEAKIAANANKQGENRLIEVAANSNNEREQAQLPNPNRQTANTKEALRLIEENYNIGKYTIINDDIKVEAKPAVPLSDETMNYLNNLFNATQQQSIAQTEWLEASTGAKQTPWLSEVNQTKLPAAAYNRIYGAEAVRDTKGYTKIQQRFMESAVGINVIESEILTDQDIKFARENPRVAMWGYGFNVLAPLAIVSAPTVATAVASLGETASVLGTGVSTEARSVFQPAVNQAVSLFSGGGASTAIPVWAGGGAGGSSAITAVLPNPAPFINLLAGTGFFYSAKATSDLIGDLRQKLPVFNINNSGASLLGSGYNYGMMGAGSLFDTASQAERLNTNITLPVPTPPMNIFSTPKWQELTRDRGFAPVDPEIANAGSTITTPVHKINLEDHKNITPIHQPHWSDNIVFDVAHPDEYISTVKGGDKVDPEKIKYEPSDKHHPNSFGDISKPPTNPQAALENAYRVNNTASRIIAVDKENEEFVVFDKTRDGVYHGHARKFNDLNREQQNVLWDNNLVKPNGKIRK